MRKVLSILGQLSDDDVEWLVQNGTRQHSAAGTVLITAGQPVSHLYIVLHGEVVVQLPNGVQLARLGEGEVLGEMSLVDQAPPTASVLVAEAAVFLAVEQRALRRQIDAQPLFAAHLYRAIAAFLAMRMRATTATLGYGESGPARLADEVELDETILDHLHLAGARFERMRRLLDARS